ncbi:MAG: hypothetical protein J6Q30_07530, partial [Oscillospiraceae bacterium]|nr:hypothetical protein [Oscillospiraceae bacterium]
TLSILFSVISAKRSLDSASRNYGMLATGKHPIQNRFAMLGMTAWVITGNCSKNGNLIKNTCLCTGQGVALPKQRGKKGK